MCFGRKFICMVLLLGLFLVGRSEAIVYIEIDSPNLRLYRLAFLCFSQNRALSEETERIMRRCLEISYLFEILPPEQLPPSPEFLTPRNIDHQAFRDAGAEFVLSVLVEPDGEGLRMGFFAFDPVEGITIGGKRYRGSRRTLRLMAYRLIDDFLELLTGQRGPFESRIAFIRHKDGFRELWMTYPDGGGEIPLITRGLCMSPAWAPGGDKIVFTGFRRRNPDLYLLDLPTGKLRLLSSRPGPNCAAAWSPDGKNLVLSMRGERGEMDLFLLRPKGGKPLPLTRTPYVETSPTWSPDGRKIAFVSDRTGTPQIYVMDVKSKEVKPLTRFGTYNCSPAWSPRGDWIAFSGKWEGEFKIFLIRPDGSDLRLITPYGGNHEDPSWAPNGRHIAFSSDMRGQRDIYITTIRGGGPWAVTLSREEESQPAWSPLLR